jgi:hypothetical protein
MTEKPPTTPAPESHPLPLLSLTMLARLTRVDRSVIKRLWLEDKLPNDRWCHEYGPGEKLELRPLFTIARIGDVQTILAAEEAERQAAKAGKEAQ